MAHALLFIYWKLAEGLWFAFPIELQSWKSFMNMMSSSEIVDKGFGLFNIHYCETVESKK